MKNSIKYKIINFLVLLALVSSPALALDVRQAGHDSANTPCIDLLKDCYLVSGFNRDACFYSAATHEFCSQSDLGVLALKRWQSSPSSNNDFELAPSNILDHNPINQQCVVELDNKLSALLLSATLTNSAIQMLTEQIDNCQAGIIIDLVRP